MPRLVGLLHGEELPMTPGVVGDLSASHSFTGFGMWVCIEKGKPPSSTAWKIWKKGHSPCLLAVPPFKIQTQVIRCT